MEIDAANYVGTLCYLLFVLNLISTECVRCWSMQFSFMIKFQLEFTEHVYSIAMLTNVL